MFSVHKMLFLSLFLFVSISLGCEQTSVEQLDPNIKDAEVAKAAVAIGKNTGWSMYSVQVTDVDEGTFVLISRLPGRDDAHCSFLIDRDGSVTEL